MTVRELIAQLETCNPNAVVCTAYMPEHDGDLIIQRVQGITDRGILNQTTDRISLDIA